jgi:CHAT domain-containing protein/tetratricopeptide (TPR) repeat protein
MRTLQVLVATIATLSGANALCARAADGREELLAQYRQAEALSQKGRLAEAIKLYEQIVARAPDVFGAGAKDTANMINNLAELYRQTGQFAKAVPLYQRSLDMYEKLLGKDDLAVAASLDNLALCYYEMGEYAKSEPLNRRCLQIREKRLGKEDVLVAATLYDLALLYKDTGRFADAEAFFQRSLEIREAKLGKDHVRVGVTLNGLALLRREMGQYARAEPLFRRCLQILEAQLGKDHPAVATSLSNLAVLYRDMGQYARAEALFQRALEILEAKLGKDHLDVAICLNNMASVYLDTQQYDKAEALYERSLHIWEARLGKDHADIAVALGNLATLYVNSGKPAKAEPLLQRGLQIAEAKLGPDHPRTAILLHNLAALYRAQGDYAKAEPLQRRALKIQEAKLGPDHPDVAASLNGLIKLEAAQGHFQPALEFADRMRRLDRRQAARTLPVLAESEQLAFLRNTDQRHTRMALSVAVEARSPEAAALSAAWVLNGKAIGHQTLAERALLARDARNTKAAPLVAELTSVRRQLTTRALAPYVANKEDERLQELARLSTRERELSAQLGMAVGRPVREDPWVELTEVRQAIPRDAILIEIALFDAVDFKAKEVAKEVKGPRYAAWLIPSAGQGEVKLVDLGDAARVDQAVQAVRDGLRAAQGSPQQKSVILDRGEADAEKEMRPALAALAKLIVEPLAEPLAGKSQWIVSPDGALWLVPWAALLLADGSYALEKHHIRYVISGRDLVMPPAQPPAQRDASLLVADPDFDLDPNEAVALAAKLLGDAPPADTRSLAPRPEGLLSHGVLGKVARLEGTAQEAADIKPNLKKYTAEDPWVYRGKNALEAVVKAFHGPKVVVLSTHGFFLESQEVKDSGMEGSKRPLLTKDGKLPENPLLRCGLLLAGCNQAARAKPNEEDGVLTGLEIVGLDLRGTGLVVLSACETGLGQVRNGEGVAGLRQAFHLAGAQTVVASLWQVSDRDTAFLMTDFFEALAKGKGRAEALRDAQLARLKSHRNRYGAAHPYFWAAFTLTGK